MSRTATQYDLDSMLRFGVICSIVWFLGIGSLCAFYCGLRGRVLIRRSNGELVGMGKVYWCICVGAIGIVVWGPIVAAILIGRGSR